MGQIIRFLLRFLITYQQHLLRYFEFWFEFFLENVNLENYLFCLLESSWFHIPINCWQSLKHEQKLTFASQHIYFISVTVHVYFETFDNVKKVKFSNEDWLKICHFYLARSKIRLLMAFCRLFIQCLCVQFNSKLRTDWDEICRIRSYCG